MGIRFVGNGTGTSSISFTTVNLRAPAVPDSSPTIIDQTEILVSDAGIRSSYKPGQRQLEYNFRLPILNITEYEDLLEFIEKIDGANNWFTLQDHFIPKKDNIDCQTLADDDTVYNSTDLISASWPEKPIGKWVFATGPTKNIVSSTFATPIVIEITAHGWVTGNKVKIVNHATNTNANGTWTITNVDANHFSLNGSVGNGVGGASGTASGSNIDLRRRIVEYQSGGPDVIVSPAFPNLFNIGATTPDTFIIGVPVILASKEIRRQARAVNFWDVQLSFVEKGD